MHFPHITGPDEGLRQFHPLVPSRSLAMRQHPACPRLRPRGAAPRAMTASGTSPGSPVIPRGASCTPSSADVRSRMPSISVVGSISCDESRDGHPGPSRLAMVPRNAFVPRQHRWCTRSIKLGPDMLCEPRKIGMVCLGIVHVTLGLEGPFAPQGSLWSFNKVGSRRSFPIHRKHFHPPANLIFAYFPTRNGK